MTFRLLVLALVGFGCAAQNASVKDSLNATAWVQTSVEYGAATRQAYRSARLSLPKALKSKAWTAALEQTGEYGKLPPAIIVDIDETVLDNSRGQARFLLEGTGRYTPELWRQWTREKKATAVPGALAFLLEADARGVTVFYVTNRGLSEESDTRQNLLAEKFPVKQALGGLGDTLLMNGEKENWTSDKSTRRAAVAAHYRVIFLCGDDLNDFFSARMTPEKRALEAQKNESWWGERWIILPNPMYGSWEDSLIDFDRSLGAAAVQDRKMKALKRE